MSQSRLLIGPMVSSFSGRIGAARVDITPLVGIYARNWGAALHDVAESIHLPLTLGALVFQPHDSSHALVLVEADMCIWPSDASPQAVRNRVIARYSLRDEALLFSLTHTHAAPRVEEPNPGWPGAGLVAVWSSAFLDATLEVIRLAFESAHDAILDWNVGSCRLAANRDFRDPSPGTNRYICGLSAIPFIFS